VDYLEAHYYKEWELVTYYSNGDGTYDWTGFQAFYETLLMETMVTVRGSFPLENVLLGEFGMWLGSGSDVGVTTALPIKTDKTTIMRCFLLPKPQGSSTYASMTSLNKQT
jgi:hypothetical protein